MPVKKYQVGYLKKKEYGGMLNVQSLFKYLLYAGKRVFYHTNEDVVMTSKGDLWALPGKGFPGSYIVLPENTKELIPEDAMGICTDYAIKYRDMYK